VKLVLVLSTMLHGIGVGNMLPAWVRLVCVDINPAVVTKLADRGSSQTIGIVTTSGSSSSARVSAARLTLPRRFWTSSPHSTNRVETPGVLKTDRAVNDEDRHDEQLIQVPSADGESRAS